MRKRYGQARAFSAVVGIAVFLWPDIALGNAVTALMWLPLFQLLVGNLILGVGEGLILACLLRVGRWRAVLVMIGANYASFLFGNVVLGSGPSAWSAFGSEPLLYAMPRYLVVLATATFFATVLIEWPFCLALATGKPRAGLKSLGASTAIHLVSYGVLVWLYVGASRLSLYRNLDVRADFVPSLPPRPRSPTMR